MRLRKIKNYFLSLTWPQAAKITWLLIGCFILYTFSICLYKYFTYQFNNADLAIYNQVFYNSSEGRFFDLTINPHSYLGDHFEIIILLLLPFYSLFRQPLTLLFIQTCFAAFSAIPLFLICRRHLSPILSLLIIILFLFNPLVINYSIIEFHVLPLMVFFVFWAFYFYDRDKFRPFIIFCCLSLLVREDVSFIIFMFGILAIFDKKPLKWILMPLAMSVLYFFLALKICAFFAPLKHYKFLTFYSWLGYSLPEIFANFFLKFPLVLQTLFLSRVKLETLFSLFFAFFFLPVLKPKHLLLVLGPFLEFFLVISGSYLILMSQYTALFIPGLFFCAIFSVKKLAGSKRVLNYHYNFPEVIPAVILCCLIYQTFLAGPLVALATNMSELDYGKIKLQNEFIKSIPDDQSLLASFEFLAPLSSRQGLYVLILAYANQLQFDEGAYTMPENLKYILINLDSFMLFENEGVTPETEKIYSQGDENMRKLLAKNYQLIKIEKNLALWEKNSGKESLELYNVYKQIPEIKNKKSQVIGSQMNYSGYDENKGNISLYFQALQPIAENYLIKINDNYFMLGYGIYPTSAWQTDEIIKLNFYGLNAFDSFQIWSGRGQIKRDSLNRDYLDYSNLKLLGEVNLN